MKSSVQGFAKNSLNSIFLEGPFKNPRGRWRFRVLDLHPEGCDHLAHDGDDDDFGLFVGGGETIVEDFESGIVSASAQSLLSISATRVSALFQRASSSPATNRLAASAAL